MLACVFVPPLAGREVPDQTGAYPLDVARGEVLVSLDIESIRPPPLPPSLVSKTKTSKHHTPPEKYDDACNFDKSWLTVRRKFGW